MKTRITTILIVILFVIGCAKCGAQGKDTVKWEHRTDTIYVEWVTYWKYIPEHEESVLCKVFPIEPLIRKYDLEPLPKTYASWMYLSRKIKSERYYIGNRMIDLFQYTRKEKP